MRIAIWHDPPPGGARRALEALARDLTARHHVDIYTTAPEARVSRDAAGVGWIATGFRPRSHHRGAAYWNDVQTWRDFQDFRSLERGVAARIDDQNYDVVVTSVLRNGQAPDAIRFLRTPTAYYCHEPIRRASEPWCRPDAAPLSPYEQARRLWRLPTYTALDHLVRRRDQRNVRAAGLVLTNSTYTAQRIRDVYHRPADVCWLGVDTDLFRPLWTDHSGARDDAAGRPNVLSVGALEPHKGFDFVIEALGKINAERRPRLTIVGSGGHPAMPGYLHTQARAQHVSLEILTDLPDAALADLYRSSTLFAFGAHLEPFGLVLLEAMASGIPVVAVDEGGVGDSVVSGQTGWPVARNAGAFAAAIDDLLRDPATRASMGRAARAAVEARWTWRHAAQRLEVLLERFVHGTPPPAAAIEQ